MISADNKSKLKWNNANNTFFVNIFRFISGLKFKV